MNAFVRLVTIPRRAVRRAQRELFSSAAWLRVEARWQLSLARRLSRGTERHGLVILPTVGMGNIGDQAMLEAVIANVEGPITVVLDRPDSHRIPDSAAARVTVEVIPGVVAGTPWTRRKSVPRFLVTAARHRSVAVIGADIMDGGYDAREAALRFSLLAACAHIGLDTRVLGFSWNGRPPESVVAALRSSQPSALLCVRDPHSLRRLDPEGNLNSVLTTDTVFSLGTLEGYEPLESFFAAARTADREVIVVNASGLLLTKSFLVDEYADLVRELISRGCSVVLLPHVVRAGDDDLRACRAVAERVGADARVLLVEETLHPGQVAWAASQATGVVTGRMHLSILALNRGVPAAVISTQGKVSGLLELFGLEDFAMEPEPGLGKIAVSLVDRILDGSGLSNQVAERLSDVRALSSRNFANLPT